MIRSLVLLAAVLNLAAPAHADCTYLRQMVLPVRYLPGSALPLVDGSIDGKPAAMAIETGAYTTALLAAQAERRGLALRTRYEPAFDGLSQLNTTMAMLSGGPDARMELRQATESIVGAGENVATYLASVKAFSIGPVKAPRGKLPAVDSRPDAPYDAIVGADFLFQSDLELALAENELRLFRGHGCADAFLAYWDDNAVVVPLEKTAFPQSVITVSLNGKPALAMIDTGAVRSFVVPKLADALGVRETAGPGEQQSDAWLAKFDTLAIGNATFESPYLYVSRHEMARPVPWQVVLGLDFLKTHRVLLAGSQQKLYVSVKASAAPFPAQRPSVNIERVDAPRQR